MESKIFSGSLCFKAAGLVLLMAVLAALTGCAGTRSMPDKAGQTSAGSSGDYRAAASGSLTMEGRRLLQQKDYDRAIRVLERAVGLNPSDGRGYFYLAEAWFEKKNFELASRFNDLAVLYLKDNPDWSSRARSQKERIKNSINGQ